MERELVRFPLKELRCRCAQCGGQTPHEITEQGMNFLAAVRDELDEPMSLTSAYRCANHPEETKKSKPGTHNRAAFDVKAPNGAYAYRLAAVAMANGATGIGFSLSNKDRTKRFIHLDYDSTRAACVIWSY